MHMMPLALMIGKFGATELIIILLIVLVLFGPKQLPKLSKMFGKSIKGFKEGMQEDADAEPEAETKQEVTKPEDGESSDKTD